MHQVALILICLLCFLSIVRIQGVEMAGLGKQRRALRSLANKLKQSKELCVVQCNEVTEPFKKNLLEQLNSLELVQVRLLSVEKRKEAETIGLELSAETEALLAQVVGHTILLYKESSPRGKVSKMLEKESLAGEE